MSQKQPSNSATNAEEERRKQEEIARKQQENARKADEAESESADATVSTFILPGD